MTMQDTDDMWEKVFRKNGEIVTRTIGGETLLVPIRGKLADMQRIFSINSIGGIIWLQLDGSKRLGEIRDDILKSYKAEKADIETDIREFVSDLLQQDLITGTDPS
jgi:hypothetical protein